MKYKHIIEKMTLTEKARLLSGKDFWQTVDYPQHGIPSMFLSDGPTGIRKQAAAADHLGLNASIPATCFPTSATVANSWNEKLGEQIGRALGEEAVALKVNVLLGPGLNMKRNPRCGRNFEYFSEDPYLAGKMAAAWVRGLQSNGISSCCKHFACNNQEERRMASDSVMDERTLREIYLTAFEIAVKEGGTKTIMSSYNLINGEYANENMHCLKEILRDEWGFNGVVVTDWGGDNDRVAALLAGNELEMPTTGGESSIDIERAVNRKIISEDVVDEAVDRLLDLIYTTEEVYKDRPADQPNVVSPEAAERHHAIARQAAEESMVLLKNNGILPLKKGAKVALIGDFVKKPRYQGAGSSIVNPIKLDDTLEILGEYSDKFEVVGTCAGFDRYGKKNAKLTQEAVDLAKKAEIVLAYIGLDEVTETEGMDRVNIKIPQNQIDMLNELIKVNDNVVVVLACGSAVELPFVDAVPALLHTYLPGQAGARAILDILVGTVNPSGKLSESYPIKYEDCSCADNYPGHGATAEYREGLYIGYRYYDTAGVPVAFPFGFGLSYTTFEYSNLVVEDDKVTFVVKNTGAVDGAEVSQLYIGKKDGEIFRPKKELKGFAKTSLKAGEQQVVEIKFDDKSFRYFNVATNKWEEEAGEYQIYIGASSADIKLEGKIERKGTGAPNPYNKEELAHYYSGDVVAVPDAEFEKLLGRPIPNSELNKGELGYNDTLGQLKYAKGGLGRFAFHALNLVYKIIFKVNRGLANVLQMGVMNLPFRGLERMAGGIITMPMVDGILKIVNGKPFGIIHTLVNFGNKGKRQ